MDDKNLSSIRWALDALRANADVYALADAYYEGDQRLAFATDKFRNTFGRLFRELSINHCAVCVDVPADKLQIERFDVVAQSDALQTDGAQGGTADEEKLEAQILEIWRRNRMNKRAGEVHAEALKSGDAYVIVDWSDNRATIYPNLAGRCAVQYDDENPGVIQQAARWWLVREPDGKKWRARLNIYTRNAIEKYQSSARTTMDLPTKAGDFSPIDADPIVPNSFDKVPVFHFANNAAMGTLGRSELKDIIAPQDGLNKAVCDAMVGAEFAALGQRYAIGLELHEDENGNVKAPFSDGLDKLWVAPPQKDVDGAPLDADKAQPISFGQFQAANLTQLLAIKDEFRKDISLISGIPAHYFMETGGLYPSGESLKVSESRLTAKVRDRQVAFGNIWDDVVRFCLEIEGQNDVQVETQWANAAARSEKEDVENAAIKAEKLKLPTHEIWRGLGYKPEQIAALDDEAAQEAREAYLRDNTVEVPTVARGGNDDNR